MSNIAPSEKGSNVTVKVVDLSAEAKKAWGPDWNKPSTSYRFSNGREFELRTQDAAIYQP